MIKFLAMLILVTGMAYSADEAKLAASDQAAIDKAIEASLSEPSKAYQAYQTALTKASEKAIKDLEKLKANAMKGNNLPLAVAIDGKIAEVKKGALGGVIVEKAEKAGDLLGGGEKVDVAKAIVGEWKGSTAKFKSGLSITINKDKTASWNNGVGSGTWVEKNKVITVTWKTGYVYTIELSGNKINFKETNRVGEQSDIGELTKAE